eukprot:gene10252-13789_t
MKTKYLPYPYLTIFFVFIVSIFSSHGKRIFSKSLDDSAFDNWQRLSIAQRIPYLLDNHQLLNLEQEFIGFYINSNWLDDYEDESYIDSIISEKKLTIDMYYSKLGEFQLMEQIKKYFAFCDLNKDNMISFLEYCECRGYHDINGNSNDISEFDVLENVILGDFKIKRDSLPPRD